MRSTLFNDHLLHPVLTFISPSGRGVKAFVPYDHLPMANDTNSIIEKLVLRRLRRRESVLQENNPSLFIFDGSNGRHEIRHSKIVCHNVSNYLIIALNFQNAGRR